MNRAEFLGQLKKELNKNNISDVTDIIGEYEQHFAFKLADGFSEEEIAAKLGAPANIAAQFGSVTVKKEHKGNRSVASIGLFFTGIAAGIFFILLTAWGVVLAAFSICSAVVSVSMISGMNPWSLIPPMPYGIAIIMGVVMGALSVLSAVGCFWFAAFLRQMFRVYVRFNYNTMAEVLGNPVLPSIAFYPCFRPLVKRRLRRIAVVALSVFAVFFIIGLLASMICSGSLQFWHTWNWFGYEAQIKGATAWILL